MIRHDGGGSPPANQNRGDDVTVVNRGRMETSGNMAARAPGNVTIVDHVP